MKTEFIGGIKVNYDEGISKEELANYVNEEKEIYKTKGKTIASMEVKLDGDEIEIASSEKSPINRVRRITGYLSTIDRFNDAKRAELTARVAHG